MTDRNRPLKIFGGLAAAAALLLGGVTYERWLPGMIPGAPSTVTTEPQQQASNQAPAEPAAPQPEATQAAPSAASTPTAPANPPAAEQPSAQAPAASAEPPKPVAPEFDTVRVEPTGEAIVAGKAMPGSEITVKLNGVDVGKAVANSDGAWVLVPDKPLPQGTGALSLEEKTPGSSSVVVSEQTVAVAVPEKQSASVPMVALVKPDEPTKVLQAPDSSTAEQGAAAEKQPEQPAPAASETQVAANPPATETAPTAAPVTPSSKVVLDSVDYNDTGDIIFSGRAAAESNVRIYVDNAPVGDAASGTDGKWTFVGKSEIKPGGHSLRVDQIDNGGKVTSRIELPFMREEPERVVALNAPAGQTVPQAPEAGTAPVPAPATQSATNETPATTSPPNGKIVIQPGNNLWKLSRVIYGRGVHYTVIYQANKDQIRNPDRIYPGQVFTTPNAKPPEQIDPKRKQPLTPEEGGVKLD